MLTYAETNDKVTPELIESFVYQALSFDKCNLIWEELRKSSSGKLREALGRPFLKVPPPLDDVLIKLGS